MYNFWGSGLGLSSQRHGCLASTPAGSDMWVRHVALTFGSEVDACFGLLVGPDAILVCLSRAWTTESRRLCCMQRAMYHRLHTTCYVQYATHNLPHGAYNMLAQQSYNELHATYQALRTTCQTQNMADSMLNEEVLLHTRFHTQYVTGNMLYPTCLCYRIPGATASTACRCLYPWTRPCSGAGAPQMHFLVPSKTGLPSP